MEHINFLKEKLFSVEEGERLAHHKYKGGSLSLYYNYIASPFSEFLVQKLVPRWVA